MDTNKNNKAILIFLTACPPARAGAQASQGGTAMRPGNEQNGQNELK